MNQFQVQRHDMNYSHRARFVDNDWNFFLGSLVDIFHLPIHLVMTTKFIQIIFCFWTHLSGLNASYRRCKDQHKNLEIELQCLFCRKREISISCKPFRILLKVGIVETKGRQSMHNAHSFIWNIFFKKIVASLPNMLHPCWASWYWARNPFVDQIGGNRNPDHKA